MALDPLVAQRLMEDVPEMQVFRAFVVSEAKKLNSLDGIDVLPIEERGTEATARLRAFEVLTKILAPLINTQTQTGKKDADSFVV